ncbi:MAG: tetratricopeptide repeat protein, partial [Thaumarchaeota archaeon]|nr:tetratricopeptide repeat protein [Nitrososphaerota archaeon]
MSQEARRLAAVMFTDMVGYTALGQRNESLALTMVEEHRKLVRPIVARHNGREVKTMGDAFLVEFMSALDAVRCAYDIQRAIREFNISLPADRRIQLRVGIHVGDVVESHGDISGDAVNLASRIESIAEDGTVYLSRQVYDQVQNKFDLDLTDLGARTLKNVSSPVEVYRIVMPWESGGQRPVAGLDSRRVAILPFANMSPDPADEYFADGMTEELIGAMSRIAGLRVIARTSVMGYKRSPKRIDEVAKELDVGTVLEGSVRKAGERVRISVQLIDSKTGEHLWSDSYDRDLKDALAIQSDISKTVAEELEVKLLSHEKASFEKRRTVNPDAYLLYLKGRSYWAERTELNTKNAIECFEQAIALDPAMAPAYSGLADCYNVLSDYGWMQPDRASPMAKQYSIKALEVDPDLAEAHASLAWTLMSYSWDFVSAGREFRRATALRPNYAIAYHWYAILHLFLRKCDDALSLEQRAYELDPYSRTIGMSLANCLAVKGRTRESMEQFAKLTELHPNFAAAY